MKFDHSADNLSEALGITNEELFFISQKLKIFNYQFSNVQKSKNIEMIEKFFTKEELCIITESLREQVMELSNSLNDQEVSPDSEDKSKNKVKDEK